MQTEGFYASLCMHCLISDYMVCLNVSRTRRRLANQRIEHALTDQTYVQAIVVTVDATRLPVEFFYLYAGVADYFHHGGQRYQNFGLQPTKWIKLVVSLLTAISNRLM